MRIRDALSKAVDVADNVLTPAVARHGMHRDATKFARSVKLHKPYYVIVTHNMPWGGTADLVHEHVFVKYFPITGDPITDGGTSAATLHLHYGGQVFTERPPGLQTLTEFDEAMNKASGPDIRGNIRDFI